MELDKIQLQTTWNDAAGSINQNFAKLVLAITALQNGGSGLDEAQLEQYLTDNGYTKQDWVLAQKYITLAALEGFATEDWVNQQKFLKSIDGSAFISVSPDGIISLDVDDQGGLGATEQGLGIVSIPDEVLNDSLKTINGESIVGKGNIVIPSAPTGDFVTKDELIAEIGEAYPIYLAQENDEQKEANRAAIAAYVAAEVKPILYPYGETRATAPFSVTTHEMEDGIEAIIQYRVGLAVEPTMGEAYYLITAKVNKDGSVEIQNDAPAEYILPAEEYVKEMIGESYPVYTPLDGQELTEEQKAANKEAYDAVVAAWGADSPQMPHLYPYDLGRQFPFIVFDFNVDDGYAEILLNADLMPVALSDYSLPILGTGLVSISEGLKLYADGSVTFEYGGNFISPDIMTMRALIEAKNVETRWLYVSLPGGSISATQQNYNKETVEKIANGGNVKLMIWPVYAPVSHVFADGGIVFTVALYNDGALKFGQGSVGPDGTYEYAEYTIGQGGTGGGGITTETDPVFSASAAAGITEANIADWNNKVDKVSGKGLSTNDYTNTEKDKLAGIAEGAEVNVQSDWNATSGDAFIKNKPTIPAAVTESTVSGWGFTKNTGTYSKPSSGIPKSDLASSVQTSLGKADTALQSYTEQYKGTVTGVKVNDSIKSPSNGIVDLGTIPTTIDASMSDTSTNPAQNKAVKAYVDSKAATAGQMPVLSHGSSETSLELTPNVMHRWTNAVSQLTISLKSVSSAYVQHYMMQFTTSTAGCTLTMPSGIQWASGLAPIMKPDTTYQISIVNYCGVWNYYE